MQNKRHYSSVVILGLLVSSLTPGCTSIDPASVRATKGAPASAQVDRLEIPYDDSLPTYALAVKTFVQEGPTGQVRVDNHEQTDDHTLTKGGWSKKGGWKENAEANSIDSQRLDTKEATRGGSNSPSNRTQKPTTQGSATVQQAGLASVEDRDGSETQRRRREDFNRNTHSESSREFSEKSSGGSRNHTDSSRHHDSTTVVTGRSWNVDRRDTNIAAQFTSSLSGVKNFRLLDPASVASRGGGIFTAMLPEGVKGPYIVKAIVTEEVYEVEGGRTRVRLPGIFAVKSSHVEGVVVLDITVTDGSTGAIVTAFSSEGTFKNQDNRGSVGVLLPLYERHSFARSVVTQAQRVALNDAAQRIFNALREYQ
jgi:hypothetical protein